MAVIGLEIKLEKYGQGEQKICPNQVMGFYDGAEITQVETWEEFSPDSTARKLKLDAGRPNVSTYYPIKLLFPHTCVWGDGGFSVFQ